MADITEEEVFKEVFQEESSEVTAVLASLKDANAAAVRAADHANKVLHEHGYFEKFGTPTLPETPKEIKLMRERDAARLGLTNIMSIVKKAEGELQEGMEKRAYATLSSITRSH